MPTTLPITLFYAPQTRATGVRVLLDELGAPYRLHALNRNADDHRSDAFLAVNPLGKVPAVTVGDTLITEQGAIYTYLADLFPEAGLAPALDDPLRGAYLRWLFLYGSCLEPAVVDRFMEREPGPRGMSPYGTYDAVLDLIVAQLTPGPYLFGERFTAADLLWGTALSWLTAFKLVPEDPPIRDYVKRIQARPIVQRVQADDAELAKRHQAEAVRA
ncbi:glutathione S-transferase family protein [Lichenihabitans sp. Uapishka_5]|uniref:glutathione S-transferase family protein n=1 Tax=Lichenihabitans sp. Uapishka_5 TaxID=3037302 RepID=UPI0029E7CF6B|nr:glutathione S-transferase family protein [Lichenihabitans sp. Uapishka_5]MDX7952780.1 glutathione S-transferase family protein [Lichenihabitans sp. Uapishka_5]